MGGGSQHTSAALTINENFDKGERRQPMEKHDSSFTIDPRFSDVRKGSRFDSIFLWRLLSG